MVVGLGTGSTAAFAVERVGQKLKSGELKDIICIPTSIATETQAKGLGIPLCTLNEKSRLDVAIDGADAVDPNLALIKGGGGALLREKMVEVMADKFICIVDDSKLVKGLGPSFALPVEITPFCHEHTMRLVAGLKEVAGCTATLRMGKVSTGAKKDGDDIAVTGIHPNPYEHNTLCIPPPLLQRMRGGAAAAASRHSKFRPSDTPLLSRTQSRLGRAAAQGLQP